MSAETSIVEKLTKILSQQGHNKLSALKGIQLYFLKQSLKNLKVTSKLFDQCVEDIFSVVSLSLIGEHLTLPEDGLIVISNHLGINKLTKIYPEEIESSDIETPILPALENNDPFTLLFAPIEQTLSKLFVSQREYSVIYVFMKLNNPLDDILNCLNVACIERYETKQYQRLKSQVIEKVKKIRAKARVPIVVIFPEGGTSGKETFSGPYSLIKFKTGYKYLANDLKLPILPIGIKVDSELNYSAVVGDLLNPRSHAEQDRDYLGALLELA